MISGPCSRDQLRERRICQPRPACPTAARTPTAHRPAPSPPGDTRAETGFFARYNGCVLVADDNESNRDMLTRRLQRQGMKVETSTDGRQTLEMVRNGTFDVVLLDIVMPGLDGFNVLQ